MQCRSKTALGIQGSPWSTALPHPHNWDTSDEAGSCQP